MRRCEVYNNYAALYKATQVNHVDNNSFFRKDRRYYFYAGDYDLEYRLIRD
jgi:hypothetical protein